MATSQSKRKPNLYGSNGLNGLGITPYGTDVINPHFGQDTGSYLTSNSANVLPRVRPTQPKQFIDLTPKAVDPFAALQAKLSKHSYGDPNFYNAGSSGQSQTRSPKRQGNTNKQVTATVSQPKPVKSSGPKQSLVNSEIDRLEKRQKLLSTSTVISMPTYHDDGRFIDPNHTIPGPAPKDRGRVYGYGSGHYGMPLPNPQATPESTEFIANQKRLQRLQQIQAPSSVLSSPNGGRRQNVVFKDAQGNISDAFSFEMPEGVSVDQNIRDGLRIREQTKHLNDFERHTAILKHFSDTVKGGAPMDYKLLAPYGKQGNYKLGKGLYESLGNFNYGAYGRALGIDEDTLLREAGRYQEWSHTSQDDWKNGLVYGDDPIDQMWIKRGYRYGMENEMRIYKHMK